MLSEGVRQELLSCYNYQKFDQTILILPPPKSELATLDDDDLIQMFPRGIWANEFHTSDLFNSFIIIDLLERAIQIAGLSKEERVSLVDGRVRRSKYPVTYKGVVDGYVNSARMSEINDEVFGHVEDEASWHYKFWGYFRALSILSLQLTRRQIKLEDTVYQMCECYLKMGYLMLRGERQGKTIIIRGDVEFARQCATSAYSLASNNQITYYERLAESLFEEINKMESAIEANKDSVIIKSPIKGIMTKKGSVSDLT